MGYCYGLHLEDTVRMFFPKLLVKFFMIVTVIEAHVSVMM